MAKHLSTGKQGEALATAWLQQRGYSILYNNWRYKQWEIDIIAHRENRLHIIEVKTRTSNYLGHPEENLTDKKMQYLINAAEEFMIQYPQWKYLQFDVLAITLQPTGQAAYFFIEDVYL